MKMNCKLNRRAVGIAAVLVMMIGTVLPVAAANMQFPDLTKTGSVTLTLADSAGNAVSGGAVTLYEVAALSIKDNDMAYSYTEDFAGCAETLDAEDSSLAETLAGYAEEHSIGGTTVSVSTDGTVSFDGLELGLYLIVQTEESDNYETINPFMVTVPIEEDGLWVYTVDASPKVGTVTPAVPDEPDEPEEPSTPQIPSTPSTTTTTKNLPQTGQLIWPIPVLAACGGALLVIGKYLKRKPVNDAS